jgi:hypothetical protein
MGMGVFRKFLLGSVTFKVLHNLGCPVLTGAHLIEQSGNPALAQVPPNSACQFCSTVGEGPKNIPYGAKSETRAENRLETAVRA